MEEEIFKEEIRSRGGECGNYFIYLYIFKVMKFRR